MLFFYYTWLIFIISICAGLIFIIVRLIVVSLSRRRVFPFVDGRIFKLFLFTCWRFRLFINGVGCRISLNCTWLSIFIISFVFSFFYFSFVCVCVCVRLRDGIWTRINNSNICIRIFAILIFICIRIRIHF